MVNIHEKMFSRTNADKNISHPRMGTIKSNSSQLLETLGTGDFLHIVGKSVN